MQKGWCFGLLWAGVLFGEELNLEEIRAASVASSEGVPLGIVNGVSVITGAYTEQVSDLEIPGIAPLPLTRSYISEQQKDHTPGQWCIRLDDSLQEVTDERERLHALVKRPSGASILYDVSSEDGVYFRPHIPKGYTNASLVVGGKTNLKNHSLHRSKHGKRFILTTGDGTEFIYHHQEDPEYYELTEENRASGLSFHHKSSSKHIVHQVRALSRAKKLVGWMQEKKTHDKKEHRIIEGSDGSVCHYRFAPFKIDQFIHDQGGKRHETHRVWMLVSVSSNRKPSTHYDYTHTHDQKSWLLKKKSLPGGRFLTNDYYAPGKKWMYRKTQGIEKSLFRAKHRNETDRVLRQEAPVGVDKTPLPIHRFCYWKSPPEEGRKKSTSPCTDVFDALWHKTRYTYSGKDRLLHILKYKGNYPYTLYSKEELKWGEKGSSQEGHLLGKYLLNEKEEILGGQFFRYDKYGNAVEKGVVGCLTGRPCGSIRFTKDRYTQGGERESTVYVYSKDQLNFLESEHHANGLSIHYQHPKGVDQLHGKITLFQGQVKHREFYSYDQHGSLKEVIEDDGLFFERNNLIQTTERKITRFTPQQEFPFGVPKTKREYYLDLNTGKEKLLKKSCYTYNQMAKVTREDVYDANETFAYSKSFAYDAHGNLLEEVDPLGQVTQYRYNENDDKIFSKGPNGVEHHHSFDQAGRLIEEKQIHPDGKTFVVSHRYDYLNQRIATTDWYGNETLFTYDAFGRCIEISHPQMGGERPVEQREYDHYGNVTCLTQPDGYQTKVSYNLYGKPLSIEYPDGAKESFIYHTNGLLEEKTEKNGSKKRYVYDELKRILREELWSAEGHALGVELYRYNRLHLLSKTDREGHVICYSYDGAGRLFATFDGPKVSENHYDSLGRLALQIDHAETALLYTHFSYDLLDRLVEKKVTDAAGTLFHLERKSYDAEGNTILQETDGATLLTRYNGHRQPVWMQDAMGNVTHVEYDHFWTNEIGQRVLRILSTDPEGFLNIQIFNPKGLLVHKIRQNLVGEEILHETIAYNSMGQAISVQEELMGRAQVTQYRYTPTGAVAFMREGAGGEERETLYSYYSSGKLFEQTKPDGVVLRHSYDAENRLMQLLSSDGSIHLTYRYDRKGRPIGAKDEKSGQETLRVFDPMGQLLQETFSHGHTICQSYDQLGRLSRVEIPSQDPIRYEYSGARLCAITQGDYRYQELSHHITGQPMLVQPFAEYQVSYGYQSNGRRISVQAPGFFDAFCQFDGAGNVQERQWQGETHTFTYDDFYQLVQEPGRTYRTNCLGDRILYGEREALYSSTRQIQRLGDETFLSDPNGNLQEHSGVHYSYDALDRLVAVETKQGRVEYTYDPYHRRVSRKEGASLEYYLYQGQEEIGAILEDGVCHQLKILRSLSSNTPIGMRLAGQIYFPLIDVAGNIAGLVDRGGTLHSTYRYTAFGEETSLQESSLFLPWRFATKRIDPFTSLVAFGRRDLDPLLGRWITPDPELFENGPNRYTYAKGNPFLFFDRFGLLAETWAAPHYWNFEDFHVKETDRYDIAWNQYSPDEAMFARDTCFSERTGFYQLKDIAPNTTSHLAPLPTDFGMGFVNGICNFFPDFSNSLQYLGNLSGYQIGGVHSASLGLGVDLQKAVCAKMFGICYESMREIHHALDHFFTANPNGVYLLVGHSRGCADISTALMTYHPVLRKQVLVLGVAPAQFIDRDYCMDVRHLISEGDYVYLTDPLGYQRCKNTTQLLKPHPNAHWFDHNFDSPTYQDQIKIKVKQAASLRKFE